MHNILHNMDDDSMPMPNHVTVRNGVYQYVRRVRDDVVEAFAMRRIQRSLKTRLPGEARLRAAQLDQDLERQFTAARLKLDPDPSTTTGSDWTWVEWEKVVAWLTATWLHEDRKARLRKATGKHFSKDTSTGTIWLDDGALREKIDLKKRLSVLSPRQYETDRAAYLRSYLGRLRLGAPVDVEMREEFFTACLQAEIEALDIILRRESGERVEHPHPDSIDGSWRQAQTPPSPPEPTTIT